MSNTVPWFPLILVLLLGITFVFVSLKAGEREESLQEACLAQTNSKVYREYKGTLQCFVEPHDWEDLIEVNLENG